MDIKTAQEAGKILNQIQNMNMTIAEIRKFKKCSEVVVSLADLGARIVVPSEVVQDALTTYAEAKKAELEKRLAEL